MKNKINKRKRNELEQKRKRRFMISEKFYLSTGKKLNRNQISAVEKILNNSIITIEHLISAVGVEKHEWPNS